MFKGAMLIKTGWSCTVKFVESVREPRLAKIPVDPLPTPDASPCDPDVLLIVATVADTEPQVAIDVMFAVVPSV